MEKRAAAIILAAGRGTRIGGDTPKQFIEIEGFPLIYFSLKAFSDSFADEIILVCPEDDIRYCSEEIVDKYGFTKVRTIVPGGSERYHSVYNGLKALRCNAEGDLRDPCDIVFIHDGARPFVSEDIIERTFTVASEEGAAVAAVPAKDTIRLADAEGYPDKTLERGMVWQMQTPQTFDFYTIYEAYSRLIENEGALLGKGVSVTDDAMVLELYSQKHARLVMGDHRNIKVTTPEDLEMARALVAMRRS